MVQSGRAAIRMASGSPAHDATASSVASGSSEARRLPTMLVNSVRELAGLSTLSPVKADPAIPARVERLVTRTAEPPVPGSSGRT